MDRIKENKAIVQEYAEAFSRGDFETVRALCTPDVIISGVLGKGGLDVAMPIWEELHRAFGIQLEVADIIAEGNRVPPHQAKTGLGGDPGWRCASRREARSRLNFVAFSRQENPTNWSLWNGSGWKTAKSRSAGERDFAAMMRQVAAPL